MKFVQFYKQNEPRITLPLNKNLFKVGREKDCDAIFSDHDISRLHAILRLKEHQWTIEDCSQNGIQCDGKPIVGAAVPLHLGKVYQLNKTYSFKVIDDRDFKKTQRTLLISKRPTQLLVLHANSDSLTCAQACLSGINKKGEIFSRIIDSHGLSLGQHPSNDIVLNQDGISQFHAKIEILNNQYYVSDLGSTNGTYVGNTKVLKAALSRASDLFLGKAKFHFEIQERNISLREKNYDIFFGIVSKDKAMKKIFSLIEVVSSTEAPVFLHGETGTGKELMARAIHQLSPRYQSPLVTINCAALPKELIESELFGHERGAFTGAIETRTGAFEEANGGSLFLDEIAEMDLSLQAKLLRALETGEIRRLGSNKNIFTSVRIISATHKDLSRAVKEGRFREDLYFRLHVVPIEIPSLRNRIDDLEVLVPSLLKQIRIQGELRAEVYELLRQYEFPGNIRELKNILQRAHVEYQLLHPSSKPDEKKIFEVKHFRFLKGASRQQLPQSQQEVEERISLLHALEAHNYNQTKTAQSIGLPVSTLHDRIKRYGIEIRKKRKLNSSFG